MTERGLLIMRERCNECLYSRDAIVNRNRRTELLSEIAEGDGWFICHKSTLAGVTDVMCRGFHDANPDHKPGRLAKALGLKPKFVNEIGEL